MSIAAKKLPKATRFEISGNYYGVRRVLTNAVNTTVYIKAAATGNADGLAFSIGSTEDIFDGVFAPVKLNWAAFGSRTITETREFVHALQWGVKEAARLEKIIPRLALKR